MIDYTDTVYVETDTEALHRIIEEIIVCNPYGIKNDGYLVVDINGDKISVEREYFEENFTILTVGKTLSEILSEE